MLERPHLHLSYEFRLDLSIAHDSRQYLVQVWKDKARFIVDCGINRGQSKAMVTQVTVAEHHDQHRDDKWLQSLVVRLARISKGITES